MRRSGATMAMIGASFIVPFSLFVAYWARYIFRSYFPYGDEFALLVNSTRPFHPSVLSWLREGYSHYLIAYPEWAVPSTNFLRPVANAAYYLNSVIFGTHWSCYLLLTYAIQTGIGVTALLISSRRLRLPLGYAVASVLLCLISPAFGWETMFSPAFAFDLLAALLVLLGINEFLQHRLLGACLFFTVAIFTKETALFAPVCAAVLVAVDKHTPRRMLKSAAFLFPVIAWESLRLAAFQSTAGEYPLHATRLLGWPTEILLGFLSWPVATQITQPGPARAAWFVLPNLVFWIMVGAGLIGARSSGRLPSATRTPFSGLFHALGCDSTERVHLIAFCLASLAMLLVLDLGPRFGAAFYPLFFLSLLCVCDAATVRSRRIAAAATLLVSTSMPLILGFFSPEGLHTEQLRWALSSDYVRHLSQTSAPAVFVFDDMSGLFASPEAIAAFTGYRGRLVALSDLDVRPTHCEGSATLEVHEVGASDFSLTSILPPSCGKFFFYGADPFLFKSTQSHELHRNTGTGLIRYQLPATPFPTNFPSISGRLDIELSHIPSNSVLLFPQIDRRQYSEIVLGATGATRTNLSTEVELLHGNELGAATGDRATIHGASQ